MKHKKKPNVNKLSRAINYLSKQWGKAICWATHFDFDLVLPKAENQLGNRWFPPQLLNWRTWRIKSSGFYVDFQIWPNSVLPLTLEDPYGLVPSDHPTWQHCRLYLSLFVDWLSLLNPNNNLTMRRAGLSNPTWRTNELPSAVVQILVEGEHLVDQGRGRKPSEKKLRHPLHLAQGVWSFGMTTWQSVGYFSLQSMSKALSLAFSCG